MATVSRALRGLPNVAPDTRARVEAAADALRYEIDPQASSLASGRTMTIGLVAPLFGTWYADQVVSGAVPVLSEAGFDLLVASVHDVASLESFLTRSRAFGRRVDGALLIDLSMDTAQSALLDRLGVPVVSVGEILDAIPGVAIDNVGTARMAVEHLLDLGHRRIGVLGGAPPTTTVSPVAQRRERGWREALESAGIEPEPALCADGAFAVDGGAAAMAELLDLADPPTAVFCMSDRMALGALVTAAARGLTVPGDISLMGFDDDDLAATFGLTTMRQPVTDIGARAARCLLDHVAGDGPDGVEVVPVELVVRSTTAPPRGASNSLT
ncbi:MAG: LacI family transcriptional regulator [Acidimicrobiales bacterium]|nr:MAG: LacI family transcriptional regulator [Acidimicrobiales bacterium]